MTTPNRVLFSAYTATSGTELWVSDGTAAHTSMVKDIFPGHIGSAAPTGFTQFGDRVLFSATDSTHGVELWTTDGTSGGTYMLDDIQPGSGSGFAFPLEPVGGKLVFVGNDGSLGRELWVTDGTSAGTSLLRDIQTGSQPSNPKYFATFGSRLLFQAIDGAHFSGDAQHGLELWVTDGTTGGTSLLADLNPDVYGSGSPKFITDLGTGRAVFSAAVGSAGRELWVTDGTAGGTSLLKDITPGAYKSGNPGPAVLVGTTGLAVFAAVGAASHQASGGGNEGAELWVTDGTAGGTSMLRTFSNGYDNGSTTFVASSANGTMTAFGGKVLFEGTDAGVSALWATDGTAGGTVKISTDGVLAGPMVPFGNKDLFWNSTGLNSSPWVTDGTAAGTYQLTAGAKFGETYGFAVIGDKAVFQGTATTGVSGTELWVTDGTAAGTGMLKDINTLTNGSSRPHGFAVANGRVFFQADDGTHGKELWVTDGTFFGTSMVKDINNVNFNSSAPASLAGVTLACFAAGTHIRTPRGDVPVQALRPGDTVLTAAGACRAVRWIGRRAIDIAAHPRPGDVSPVRIAAHAFGHNLPHTPLRVSPDHAIFADGVLVPARYLINGATIAIEAERRVTWYHVELAGADGEAVHDILLAEGLPAESYLDTGNRGAFANGGTAVHLHADFARAVWRDQGCAPLVTQGAELVALRSWLLERALLLGHRRTADPALAFTLDGRPVHTMRDGAWCHLDIPAGGRTLRLRSRTAIPAEIGEEGGDTRRLGVAVTALRLEAEAAPFDHPRLGDGWHGTETSLRWTDGNAALDVRGLGSVSLGLHCAVDYWDERPLFFSSEREESSFSEEKEAKRLLSALRGFG